MASRPLAGSRWTGCSATRCHIRHRKGAPVALLARVLTPCLLALSFITLLFLTATAQDTPTANVEVRVWQSTQDPESLYVSARPEGGDWGVLGTIPLDMDGLNSRETYRYGGLIVEVPLVRGTGRIDDSAACQWFVGLEEAVPDFRVMSCWPGEVLHEAVWLRGAAEIGGHRWNLETVLSGMGYFATLTQTPRPSPVCEAYRTWIRGRNEDVTVHTCRVSLWIDDPPELGEDVERLPLKAYYLIDSLIQGGPTDYLPMTIYMDMDLNVYRLRFAGQTHDIEGDGDPTLLRPDQ